MEVHTLILNLFISFFLPTPFFFFFNDTATTEIYTLSLHDALPIFLADAEQALDVALALGRHGHELGKRMALNPRSEEHTSELQSRPHLVCRLLLEKKNIQLHNNPLLLHCRPMRSHDAQHLYLPRLS